MTMCWYLEWHPTPQFWAQVLLVLWIRWICSQLKQWDCTRQGRNRMNLRERNMLSLAECQPGLLCLPNFKFTGFHADSVLWKSQLNVWLYDCMKLLCGLLLLMVAELLKKVLGHCIWLRNEREQMEHSIRSSNMKTCALIQLMRHIPYYMSIQCGQ